jgi:hypothetical protein
VFVTTVVQDERAGVCGYCTAVIPVTLLGELSAAPSSVFVRCPACHGRTAVGPVRLRPPLLDP